MKWIKRNSLNYESCCNYVSSLCEIVFNFENFKIELFKDDEKALWITYGLHSYIIFASDTEINLVVLEENTGKQGYNKYHKLKMFNGDTCWYNCLSWIKNRM